MFHFVSISSLHANYTLKKAILSDFLYQAAIKLVLFFNRFIFRYFVYLIVYLSV